MTGAWLAGAIVASAGCIRSGAAAAAGADWVLSDDADASEVGAGSLNDSKSGVSVGVGVAGAGAGTGVAGSGATCAGVGVGVGAGTAVAGGVTGWAARTGKLLPHDWQLVWPRNTSLAAQNGQIGCVDP